MTSTIGMTSRNSGFTFIEVLLVLGILMIFLGLSLPTFRKNYQSLKQANFSYNVLSLMQLARGAAIREGRTYVLTTGGNDRRITLSYLQDGEEVLVRGKVIPEESTLTSTNKKIYFYANGSVTPNLLEILTSGESLFEIQSQFTTGLITLHEKA